MVVGAEITRWRTIVTHEARRHHYVPACYLRHFAVPQDRYEGKLHAYDRLTGRSWHSTPDKLAHERDFYRVDIEGEHPNLAENTYAALETLFAPVLAGVIDRGTLPKDSATAMRGLYAFVASQAVRTPRIRETMLRFHNDVTMLYLNTLAYSKDVLMARIRESEPEICDEEAEEMYATHLEFLNAKGARVVMDQTTLVRDSLKLAADIEDVLAQRCWILGVAPDGTSFITSDDPVHLQPSQHEATKNLLWSPGFGDPYTNVLVPLSPRLMLIGLPYMFTARARVRLSKRDVAAFNSDFALSAYRFVYSTQPTFEQIGNDGSVVSGPTAALILREEPPSRAEQLGFFTSPWPSRIP
jgi:Protein of unknown function (DUF4238)